MTSSYSHEQLVKFILHIGLPERYHLHNDPPRDLAFLAALHTHMLSTIPYENLTIHYSSNHTISLDPEILYQKIVLDGRGRGGYCMENSLFYNHILRALGFSAYTVGVRIRHRTNGVPEGDYIGWRVHIVNIVTLQDHSAPYMVDVGFGGDGATKPMPLIDGRSTHNIGTQEIRLVKDFIPGQTVRTSERKLWVYQYRNTPERPWNSFYAFSELVEFLPPDFDIMNWYTGSNPESFQTFTALVVKFLRRPDPEIPGEDRIYGKRMLVNGTVKENVGGKTEVVQECRTEQERVEALKKWFGIELTPEQQASIKGYVTELRS